MKVDIERLRDDADYYGEFGRQFLSNSDIGTLLSDPKSFGIPTPDHPNLAKGRYFHQSILEPDKVKDFPIVEASTRNTKIYKEFVEANGLEVAMLRGEADELDGCVLAMTGNLEFYDGIRQEGNQYEVPMISVIKGRLWKGKADIVCTDKVIDLKTTSDITKFHYSARTYNYDSQCYIYEQLFGKPLEFYVVDKVTKVLGIFKPTEEFIKRGEEKVIRAMEVYDKYFGEFKWDDPTNHFIQQDLY
jgi:hypothetical protein